MARRDRLIRQMLRERFVFTLQNGESFDGLLDDHDETTFELVDAHAIDARNGNRADIDGRIYLPRREVRYMQRPDAAPEEIRYR